MSEWPPLITDDALSTPSSLTSLESSPEPEPAAQKSLAIRGGGLKLNALGTTELTCASLGCGRTVDPTRTSGLCAVCEQKRHSEAEKEKLRVIPSMCGKNQVRPACAICARVVALPPIVLPAQFIICTICEGKMLSANAMAGAVKPPARPPPSDSNRLPNIPLTPPHDISQPHRQPNGYPLEIKIPAAPENNRRDLPLTIKPPKLNKAANKPKKPAAPRQPAEGDKAAGGRRSAKQKNRAADLGPGYATKAQTTLKRKASTKTQSMNSHIPTPEHTPPKLFMRGFPSSLFSRWEATERAIEALSRTPHFNDRGEYLISPAPSPFKLSKDAVSPSTSRSTLSSNSALPPSPDEVPLALLGRSKKPSVDLGMLPSPFTSSPLPSRLPTFGSAPTTSSSAGTTNTASALSKAAGIDAPECPRLTLRLPSRSSLGKVRKASQSHARTNSDDSKGAAASPPSRITAPATRPCRREGCTAVLDPSHPWIFCTECLNNKERKMLSPSEPLEWNPVAGVTEAGRRKSEPSAWGVQAWPGVIAKRRRVSEPSVLSAMDKRDGEQEKTRTAEQSALPTPPPSSRQISPVTTTQASSKPPSPNFASSAVSQASIPLSPPSSPELPLAFASSSTLATRYSRKKERDENIWDSDLSDLTPLESSDDSDSDNSDVEHAQAKRGREAIGKGAPGLPEQKGFVCVRSRCQNLLAPWSKWKMCHTCRLRFRERSRERNKESCPFTREPLVHGAGADAGVGGSRVCAIRTCKTRLLPEAQYRWKLCERCRTRTRRQSRKRRYGEVGLASDEDGEDAALLAQLERRKGKVTFKKLRLTFKGATVASVEAPKRRRDAVNVIVPDDALRYPLYQTLPTLLDALRTRLLGFVTATTHYLRFKLQHIQPQLPPMLDDVQPAFFAFDGEFTVIADPSGGEVGSKIQLVQEEVGRILGVAFELAGYDVHPDGTIVGQYACIHEVLVPLPLPPLPQPSTAVASFAMEEQPEMAVRQESADEGLQENLTFDVIAKRMQGELRVSVLWDRSHKYFPGLRTVVQFKLFG